MLSWAARGKNHRVKGVGTLTKCTHTCLEENHNKFRYRSVVRYSNHTGHVFPVELVCHTINQLGLHRVAIVLQPCVLDNGNVALYVRIGILSTESFGNKTRSVLATFVAVEETLFAEKKKKDCTPVRIQRFSRCVLLPRTEALLQGM